MKNDNPCYRKGALWRTRTKITVKLDLNKKQIIEIPRGEVVMLLYYEINISYEETIVFLWKEQVCFSFGVDSGFSFELDPGGVNTRLNDVS